MLTAKQAEQYGILKGVYKALSSFKNEKLDAPLNSYPCNSGMIVDIPLINISIGIGISHSVLCQWKNKNTFDFMLTRSVDNEDTKGLAIHKL